MISTGPSDVKSEDGDMIDCVDIYKQATLDHPLLKDHIIKMRPDDDHFEERDGASSNPTNGLLTQMCYGAENSHAYGVLVVNGSSYVAARAVINVWNPSIEKDDR
ncbi:hypothetical protein OPV22_032799 [Ensete ventricosum]|uniref:Neprosin activation peptide domain-containing protein n=1 Tax=Ensete ventricosum TaxID=4639 RepID=A0AAV8PZB8_ENSVE|nr:hypothetical protein OPV22_032799 [Ensete ventricosum]